MSRVASPLLPVDNLRVIAKMCRCTILGDMPSSRLMLVREREVVW